MSEAAEDDGVTEGPNSVRELLTKVRRAAGNPPLGQEISRVLETAIREASEVAFGFCPARGPAPRTWCATGHDEETCLPCSIGRKILWHFNEDRP